MALVAPGICRYTVNGTYGTRPTANILDFRIDTTGSIVSREDAISDMAGIIINEWSDHVLPVVCSPYTATSVSWVDLDEPDGSTGSRSATDQETWPQQATRAFPGAPANVSILVTKRAASARGRRNGRLFLVGPSEADIGTQNLVPAYITTLQDSMTSMLGNLNQEDPVETEYQSHLCVVHTRNIGTPTNPEIVFNGSDDVIALAVETIVATQRRRLRG